MAKRIPPSQEWLPNRHGLPPQPVDSNSSSLLFGSAPLREFYWLPEPPGPNCPRLKEFWDSLSTGITEYVEPVRNPHKPVETPARTTAFLAKSIGPGNGVSSSGESRQSRSPNWSGATVDAVNGGTITQVVGSWKEPQVERSSPHTNRQQSRSSVWIGLNGHAAYDDAALPQIGTMQQIFRRGSQWKSEHWVWFEWWANTKMRARGNPRTVLLPTYLDLAVSEGDNVLCCVEIVPEPTNVDQPKLPWVARMCVCVEHLDTATQKTEKVLVMPFIVYPPEVDGRRVQPIGSTANWIAELPTNVDANGDVNESNPFLMPQFGRGSTPPNCVTFANCVAGLAADPGQPIYAERTLAVSSRVNMIGRRNQGEGPVGKIATTLTPRISDTSFNIQVDGNLP